MDVCGEMSVAPARVTEVDDHTLSLLIARLDEPEEGGWREAAVGALLALATSAAARAEQWTRLGGTAALQMLARDKWLATAEQKERATAALSKLDLTLRRSTRKRKAE